MINQRRSSSLSALFWNVYHGQMQLMQKGAQMEHAFLYLCEMTLIGREKSDIFLMEAGK